MKTLKVKSYVDVPQYYTGIIEWSNGNKGWVKNGSLHREDGPANIYKDGHKQGGLDGKYIWDSEKKLDLANQIILSKSQHPLYPTAQIWKILDKDKVYKQTVIPGMENHIIE